MSQDDIKNKRITTLKNTQAARKQEKLNKVYKAIERLQKDEGKINFHTVAKAAGVSVSYLYKYPEVKQHIGDLRNQQSSLFRSPENKVVSSKSHSQVVSRLKERIFQLEKEKDELRKKSEALAGQVYQLHKLQDQVERQQKIINDLQARLQDASKPETSNKVTSLTSRQKTSIPEKIESELTNLRIELNTTLIKKIKAATEQTVLEAIEALKDQLKKGEIQNPGGWLAKAIEGGWTISESLPKQSSSTLPKIFTANEQPEKELVPIEKLKALSDLFKDKDE